MLRNQNREILDRLLRKCTALLSSFQVKLLAIPNKWLLLLSLTGLTGLAILLRFLHLAYHGRHYIVSADSYFFHWLAGRIMDGQAPPPDIVDAHNYTIHSGLAYPMAYVAKGLSYVSGISSADALDLVCKITAPLIGVLIMIVIYVAVSKLSNKQVAFFASLSWVTMATAIFTSSAGFLDRDSLSILLVTLGSFLFYFSQKWRFYVWGRNIAWLLCGAGILTIEGLLYLEWSYVGPVLVLTIIVTYALVKLLLGYFERLRVERSILTRLSTTAKEINWYPLVFILLLNGLASLLFIDQLSSLFDLMEAAVRSSGGDIVAEMRGISAGNIFGFGFFLIPIALGLYLSWKRRSDITIFFSCWFLSMLILSLFAQRVLTFGIPAACLLSGIGLTFLYGWIKHGEYQRYKKLGFTILLVSILSFSSWIAYSLSSNPRVAVNEDWQDALAYLRNETPQSARIISWWDYGYWILDVGRRTPIADNGFYGWDMARLKDIALVYTATDTEEAVRILRNYKADYIVFSTLEQDITAYFMKYAGLEEQYKGFDTFPTDFLFSRVINGEFDAEDGLEVLYRSSPNSEVVVLGLT